MSLDIRLLRVSTPLVSSAPSEAGKGDVACSQRMSHARAASSASSPCSSAHARRHGELREVLEDRSRVRSSRGSRSSDRGALKDRRACSRSDSSRDRGRCSLSRSSSRLRSRGRERRRRSSSRSQSSSKRSRCDRSRSSDRSRFRRVCSRSRGDRSRSSDRYRSRRDRSRRDRSRSVDRCRSRRQRARSPACQGARGYAISLVVLVTARCLKNDFLPPLTIRDQGRKDGEPDVSIRRMWRRWKSPRLLLSLRRRLWLLALREGPHSVCCSRSSQILFESVGIFFPGSDWRCCGRGCISCRRRDSAVPFGFCRWCSRTWCCDCDSGWCEWSSFCHPTYSLVSIRKNVFWLKQNSIFYLSYYMCF